MKKFLLLTTAAIVALASCSKTEVQDLNGPQEIGFKAIPYAMTKATTALDGKTSMGVRADLGTTLYFDNTEFAKKVNSKLWAAKNDPQYWPNSGKLDFLVYAPYSASATTKTTSIEVATVPAETDFLYGAKHYKGISKGTDGVPVTLKHAKSQIAVTVQSDIADLYTVSKITLTNVETTGNVKIDYTVPDAPVVTWDAKADPAAAAVEINTVDQTISQAKAPAAYGNPVMVLPGKATTLVIAYKMNQIKCPDITLTLKETWEAGKKYTYNLQFVGNEILFNPSVDDWTAGTTTPDPLPVQ